MCDNKHLSGDGTVILKVRQKYSSWLNNLILPPILLSFLRFSYSSLPRARSTIIALTTQALVRRNPRMRRKTRTSRQNRKRYDQNIYQGRIFVLSLIVFEQIYHNLRELVYDENTIEIIDHSTPGIIVPYPLQITSFNAD